MSTLVPTSSPASPGRSIWQSVQDYTGLGSPKTTGQWSRWLLLRAIGIVYVIIFAGIVQDGLALGGPNGVVPVSEYLQHIRESNPHAISAFLSAPSLFWIDSGAAMIRLVTWVGMTAAIALILNLWPRFTLFICWVCFLAFVSTWHVFSSAQLDNLMLETALLCIPFAPRGMRPGLGLKSPPWPLAVFMMRWLLFRVMFESGVVKLAAGDPHWRDFSAMDLMYETSPFPTILGYLDHNLPRAYHVFEILFTFFVELAAPLLAVFAGRRGRWIAFLTWTAFQAGIQLTNNFGWLNTASIGLGLLLLDDHMLATAAAKLRLTRLSRWLNNVIADSPVTSVHRRWHRPVVVTLWLHFGLTLFYFFKSFGVPVFTFSPALTATVVKLNSFGSANEFYLYARFAEERHQVEFLGSNDGGLTWRPYEYRYLPQQETDICPFIAPRFARFDASLQILGLTGKPSRIFPVIASQLLKPNPEVVALFKNNPFPDAPPTLMRMRGNRLKFTDLTTWRESGRYWKIEPAGDYLPPLYVASDNRIVTFDTSAGDTALSQGNPQSALRIFSEQYQAGFHAAGLRLADMYARGIGTARNFPRAFEIIHQLALEGEIGAENRLGSFYEEGIGTDVDLIQAEHWYRRATKHGDPLAFFSLGSFYAQDRYRGTRDIEAYALLTEAANRATGSDPISQFIQNNQPKLMDLLTARMPPADLMQARRRATPGN